MKMALSDSHNEELCLEDDEVPLRQGAIDMGCENWRQAPHP